MQSAEVCADSGYGSEQNYAHMFGMGIVPYVKSTSDLGYESTVSRYRAQNCTGCPLRVMCYKGMSDRRTIEVNHQANAYRAEAKRLLTSERGVYHRSNRPIEPESVFGDIKQNHGFKRFKLKSNTKVKVEFGLVALAHNLRKYIAVERMRSNAVSCCL